MSLLFKYSYLASVGILLPHLRPSSQPLPGLARFVSSYEVKTLWDHGSAHWDTNTACFCARTTVSNGTIWSVVVQQESQNTVTLPHTPVFHCVTVAEHNVYNRITACRTSPGTSKHKHIQQKTKETMKPPASTHNLRARPGATPYKG